MGASVTAMARSRDKLEHLLEQLDTTQGQDHRLVAVDMGETEQLRDTVAGLCSEWGPIHILVNNTGGPPGGPVASATIDEFFAAFRQHLVANHVLMQTLLPGMKSEKYGRIVNVISTSVKQPLTGLGVSNTIRAAVANWAKTLAGEVAADGITVNNVLPGSTDTDRLAEIFAAQAAKKGLEPESVRSAAMAEVPAGRFGLAEEIAQAVGYLSSPAASYITGINLPVDGGRTKCL